jgi:cullin 1
LVCFPLDILSIFDEFQVTKSFLELGIINENSLSSYEPFENVFLEATQTFHKTQSRKLMFELNIAKTISFEDYMNHVHLMFADETVRVEHFFDVSSIPKVIEVCEVCLVKDHIAVFKRAFEDFLASDYFDKMDQLYDLIKRFPDEIESFTKILKAHVQNEAEVAIANLDNIQSVDMKSYVEKLIGISEKYENLIKISFDNNELFLTALEEAMKVFVNENAVTHASTYEDLNGELLARYCDRLLIKNSEYTYTNNELRLKLHHAWRIFMVLNDKDGFQKFYENITTLRLIFEKSSSAEHEKFMIQKLRDYFGEQDSKVLREILENMNVTLDVRKSFQLSVERDREVKVMKGFSVAVLAERSCEYDWRKNARCLSQPTN